MVSALDRETPYAYMDAQFLTGDVILLEDEDYTGIVIPKGKLVIVRDTGTSPKLPKYTSQAVWMRVAECDPDHDACRKAAQTVLQQQ